ncbi:MAG TPA: hypothetical protein VLZ03_05395 [Thermodesulfobacteriota bacterium]|nr:hypothetical protein [Thermodesulfobacteriota bacterium]
MKRIAFLPALVFILVLFSSSAAFGQVQTRIRAIEASNVGFGIDPSLRDVHRELGSLFSFTSYRLLRDETLNLLPNQTVLIQGHHPGRFMEVTLLGLRRNVATLRIRVIREGMVILNTEIRLFPGRTVLIGGPRRGEAVVIFAVSARF